MTNNAAFQGAKPPVLGKNRASPPSVSPNRSHIRVAVASRLMASYWKLNGKNLRGSSVLGCGRWKAYGSDPNIAEIQIDYEGARMLGHFACRSSWSCDHCAKSRVAQTRSWLRTALMPALDDACLSGSLVTLTLAHNYSDDWAEVVSRLFDAFTLMDKRLSKQYKKVGSVGKLKALEAPVGKNGLHPHLHVLLTHGKDVDLAELSQSMRQAWSKAVFEVGGKVNEHGFDFKENCVNDYVAKMEASHEMASHGTKAARLKGKTLAQLLDAAAVGDKKSGAEWLRAQKALGGRMRFHAGTLPKKLGISCPSQWEDEARAEELAKERSERPEPLRITYPQPLHLKATGTIGNRSGIALILRSARSGDSGKVKRIVASLCAEVDRLEDPVKRSFMTWTDDHFAKILEEAETRPMKPEEVAVYLEAKARGLTLVNHGQTAQSFEASKSCHRQGDQHENPNESGLMGEGLGTCLPFCTA